MRSDCGSWSRRELEKQPLSDIERLAAATNIPDPSFRSHNSCISHFLLAYECVQHRPVSPTESGGQEIAVSNKYEEEKQSHRRYPEVPSACQSRADLALYSDRLPDVERGLSIGLLRCNSSRGSSSVFTGGCHIKKDHFLICTSKARLRVLFFSPLPIFLTSGKLWIHQMVIKRTLVNKLQKSASFLSPGILNLILS